MFRLFFSCVSNIGNRRKQNQDNYLCINTTRKVENENPKPIAGHTMLDSDKMLAVFDGMGGEERGEMAAFIAAQFAARIKFGPSKTQGMKEYLIQANRKICQYAEENKLYSTGTTAAAVLFCQQNAVVMNVGDSRIYKLSGGRMQRLSVDHVQQNSGRKKPPLTQCLGIPETELTLNPALSVQPLQDGDRYLICSDGLTDMVPVQKIAEILARTDIREAASVLTQEALNNGGIDNITVIAAEVKTVQPVNR